MRFEGKNVILEFTDSQMVLVKEFEKIVIRLKLINADCFNFEEEFCNNIKEQLPKLLAGISMFETKQKLEGL